MGPRLRRLRRELGLTQVQMAADLDISPSYVALLERNQRPLTADVLLRLARTYRLDMAELVGDGGEEYAARLRGVLKDPIFADIDVTPMAMEDIAINHPAFTEALLRLYTAYREDQMALADQNARADGDAGEGKTDAVAEARRFLAARRNSFPALDDGAEQLARTIGPGGFEAHLKDRHRLRVRHIPPDVMVGALRRLDRHRDELLLDESLDEPTRRFQLALQIAYLDFRESIDGQLAQGHFATDNGRTLTRRALANYAAAALLMPYAAFSRTAAARGYDIEALALQFGVSFEQVAHRLTTLQRSGQEHIPFFFVRIDAAGNVSKQLDGAGFPFAHFGGACPLWTVHDAFRRPNEILTQWLEMPGGQRFFSVARTVETGGRRFGAPRHRHAIALVCAADQAGKLVYAQGPGAAFADHPTPAGVTCRLCHRIECSARSAPPLGRIIAPDDYRRANAPFSFQEA